MSVITISRGSFSGGKMLAECLSQELGYRCVDREVIVERAAAHGVSQEELRDALQKPPTFLERIQHKKYLYLVLIQAALIEEVRTGKAVYHGNAGHLLLKGGPHILRVRIIAPHGVPPEDGSGPPEAEPRRGARLHRQDGSGPQKVDSIPLRSGLGRRQQLRHCPESRVHGYFRGLSGGFHAGAPEVLRIHALAARPPWTIWPSAAGSARNWRSTMRLPTSRSKWSRRTRRAHHRLGFQHAGTRRGPAHRRGRPRSRDHEPGRASFARAVVSGSNPRERAASRCAHSGCRRR